MVLFKESDGYNRTAYTASFMDSLGNKRSLKRVYIKDQSGKKHLVFTRVPPTIGESLLLDDGRLIGIFSISDFSTRLQEGPTNYYLETFSFKPSLSEDIYGLASYSVKVKVYLYEGNHSGGALFYSEETIDSASLLNGEEYVVFYPSMSLKFDTYYDVIIEAEVIEY